MDFVFWNATLVYRSAADFDSIERNAILQECSHRILSSKNKKQKTKNKRILKNLQDLKDQKQQDVSKK